MAKPKAAAPTSEETPTPTFSEAVAASQDARLREADELQRAATGATPAPKVAEEELEPYEKWIEKVPKQYQEKYQESVINNYAKQLYDTFGPEVSELLGEARKDPEMLKWLGKMTNAEYRRFLRETATRVYEDPQYGGPTRENPTASALGDATEVTQKLSELEKRIDADKQQREYELYLSERRNEYQAFLAKNKLEFAPDSAVAKRIAAVIDETERRSIAQNKIIPYQDVYEDFRSMWQDQEDNPPPRPAPRQQGSGEPPKPQAPRNAVDARNNIKATLDKHGSLSSLAAALRK